MAKNPQFKQDDSIRISDEAKSCPNKSRRIINRTQIPIEHLTDGMLKVVSISSCGKQIKVKHPDVKHPAGFQPDVCAKFFVHANQSASAQASQ